MKKQILNLEGVAVLTKEQQKMVSGGDGGTCAAVYYSTDQYGNVWANITMNVSKEYAQQWGSIGNGRWCCDSCGSASWLNSLKDPNRQMSPN